MRPATEVLRERGLNVDQESISEEEFIALNIPMVVQCAHCTMTMSVLSAMINEDGFTYCKECASQ